MLKALAPSNIAEKNYDLAENINSVTCGTSQTGFGVILVKVQKLSVRND